MSVSVDKYFGWTIDLKNRFKLISLGGEIFYLEVRLWITNEC